MAVSQVGSVITITGTETGIGIFSGLTGVTINTDAIVQKCDIGTNTLVVAAGATLNIATTAPEQLSYIGDVNHNVHNIHVLGTLNLGGHTYSPANVPSYNFGQPAIVENNIYGGSPYTEDDQAAYLNQGAGDGGRLSSFYVASSGTLNLSKAGISIGGAFGAHSSSVVTIDEAEISAMQKYIFSTTYNISNTDISTFGSGAANGTGNVSMVCNPVTWDNVGGAMSSVAYLSGSSSTPVGSPIVIRNTPALASGVSLLRSGSGTGSKPEFNFYNNVDGADVTYSIELGRAFQSKIFGEFTLSSASIAGANPETKAIYVGASGTDVEVTYTGLSATQSFLLRDTDKPFNVAVTDTFYDKDGDGSSLIDVHSIAYGYLIDTRLNVDLKGAGAKSLPSTLIPNQDTTELDKSVVAAYSFINDAYQLSDALELYLFENYNKEQSYIGKRTGDAFDFGTYTVVFDKAAPALIDVTGTTITVKADAYAGLVETTSTFTLANGATQTGGIIDVNGDSFLTFEAIDSWIVYASAANRDTNTAPLDSGTGSDIYRFTFSGGTTYYLRLTTGTDIIFKDVTPVAAGETLVSLGTSALLGNINASIQESSQLAEYDGRATIDLIDGTNSTVHPYGTVKDPALTIANALVIAADIGVKRIEIRGDASALPQEVVGYKFEAGFSSAVGAKQYPALTVSALNGAKNCEFDGFEITGALDDSTDQIFNELKQCVVKNLSGVAGLIERSKLAGVIQVTHSLDIKDSYGTFVLNASGANANVSVPDFSGAITVAGMTSANARVNLGFVAGLVIIDSSCTAGEITIANQNQVVGTGGGVTVTIIEEAGTAGEADWTSAERAQIRDALGIDGTKVTAVGGQLQGITGGGDDAATIYTYFTDGTRADAFKATGFSTFNAATESVTVGAMQNGTITASVIANNAFTNSAFTTGYYNTINSELDTALADYDAPTKAELDAGLASLQSHGDITWQTATGFSTFNPATDIVARVALVDVCTENADMRGTDGANTVAPDNSTITSISATVELVRKYHDNDTVFLAADGVTQTTQSLAYSTVTFDDDGTTPLKTVSFRNAADVATTLPNATGYKKV